MPTIEITSFNATGLIGRKVRTRTWRPGIKQYQVSGLVFDVATTSVQIELVGLDSGDNPVLGDTITLATLDGYVLV